MSDYKKISALVLANLVFIPFILLIVIIEFIVDNECFGIIFLGIRKYNEKVNKSGVIIK